MAEYGKEREAIDMMFTQAINQLRSTTPGDPRARQLQEERQRRFGMLDAKYPDIGLERAINEGKPVGSLLKQGMEQWPKVVTPALVADIDHGRLMSRKGAEYAKIVGTIYTTTDKKSEAIDAYLQDNPDYALYRQSRRTDAEKAADELWAGYRELAKGAPRRNYLAEHADEFAALGYQLGGARGGFTGGSASSASPENKEYLTVKWKEYYTLKTDAQRDAWMRDNLPDLVGHGYKPDARTQARYSAEAVAVRDQQRANRLTLDQIFEQYYRLKRTDQPMWLQGNLDRMLALGYKPSAQTIGRIRAGLGLSSGYAPTTSTYRPYVAPAPRRGGGGGGGGGRQWMTPEPRKVLSPKFTVLEWFKRRRRRRRAA
jgi:hypothetical protein